MRSLDTDALRRAADQRFRSEYHYARFEYLRSPKVVESLARAGIDLAGRVLDSGCGSGGIAVSLAEETDLVVGLDLDARFRDAGTRLAGERRVGRVHFVHGDGQALPFPDRSFDLVLSHSVIEHVASAEDYLAECLRVLRPGGFCFLSTAPYLSLSGAHLPRLRVPVPVHLVLGRPRAFALFCWLGRHAPWALKEAREANTFISRAQEGHAKHDDLLQRVTVKRLKDWVNTSGFRRVQERRYVTGFFRRGLPQSWRRRLERVPWIQDVMTGNIELVLVRP